MSGASPILRLENISLVYPGVEGEASFVLRPLTVRLGRGEWVAVMGANGSGKSTLARIIAGLVTPTTGTVRFGPGSAGGSTEDSEGSRVRIGYLSQHPEHHIVGLTVGDDLLLALQPLGLSETEMRRRAREWLQRVGMAGSEAQRTDKLSGGEVQRVALAGVLASHPELLILDEPNAFADPEGGRLLTDVVGEYVCRTSAALLWITHDPDEAALADRVLVLHQGHLRFDGPPDVLWREGERLLQWGVGLPGAYEGLPQRTARPHSAGEARLVMEELTFSYEQGRGRVLSDVDLRLERGEAVSLLGASGSGKSTLLGVAALLEERENGALSVLGRDIPLTGGGICGRRRLRRLVGQIQPQIGLSMQLPEEQLFGAKVRDDFYFGLRNMQVPPETWNERITEALEKVGLEPVILDRSPFTLSGGEARKVALALTILLSPQLYLLDEPTANLDYPSRRAVADLIRDLAREDEGAVLFTTHDKNLAVLAADRTLILSDGRLHRPDEKEAGTAPQPASGREESEPTVADAHGQRPHYALDARATVLSAIVLALAIAGVSNWSGLAAASLVVAVLLILTRQPWRPVAWTFLGLLPFMIVATVFAESGARAEGLFLALRMFLTVVSVLWVTRLIALSELMRAFVMLLRPLRKVGFPVETVVASTLVAIRMVPILGNEAKKISRAQTFRGVGRLRGVRGVWSRLLSLVIPLNAAVLRRAEQLGDALTLRGYIGSGLSNTAAKPLRKRDWAALLLAVGTGLLVMVIDRGGA